MRTTVEITAHQRARLLEMAARRGQRGFSKLVREAIDAFIEARAGEGEKRQRVLLLKGSLDPHEAHCLRTATRELRTSGR